MKNRLLWFALALCLLLCSCAVGTPNEASNRSEAGSRVETSAETTEELSSEASEDTSLDASMDASSEEPSRDPEETLRLHTERFDALVESYPSDRFLPYEVLGQVGNDTLIFCRSTVADEMLVELVYDGYHFFSGSGFSPFSLGLYLVRDDGIYTLSAAYRQGLIADMGEVYNLVPKNMQKGYDPDAEDFYYSMDRPLKLVDGIYF